MIPYIKKSNANIVILGTAMPTPADDGLNLVDNVKQTSPSLLMNSSLLEKHKRVFKYEQKNFF
jgi:hypothetical protein